GTTSRKISSRLLATSADCSDRPVMFPPGRERLATSPAPSGSVASARTTGMTDDACFTAAPADPDVRITSTLSLTNSAAISANRSVRPSAQRYSIDTARLSIQPISFRRRTKAAVQVLQADCEVVPKKPIIGNFRDCCACAASGHAAAAPSSAANNSRRPMVTVIRPSRARCVNGTIPRHERAVLTFGREGCRGCLGCEEELKLSLPLFLLEKTFTFSTAV